MNRVLTLVYVIGSAIVTIVSTILEIHPALFWIDLFAPNPGDTYSVTLVLLLTFLMLLAPYIFVAIIRLIMRRITESNIVIGPERTGVWIQRKVQLQNFIIGAPVYINGQKVGVVDAGKAKFFDVLAGDVHIYVGEREQISDVLTTSVGLGKQPQLDLDIVPKANGITMKYRIKQSGQA